MLDGRWMLWCDMFSHERALNLTIAAGRVLGTDHTFKIARKIYMDGERMYEAALLVINEYGQIIAHYFLSSKSHDELKPLLQQLLRRYQLKNFERPWLW